jgi:hypothetical protein
MRRAEEPTISAKAGTSLATTAPTPMQGETLFWIL